MNETDPIQGMTLEQAGALAVRAGDESAFTALAEASRRELRVHCYRMLGSFDDAEDLVQETFLRAWRSRSSFEGRAPFRAWLYRIATNACLDFLDKDPGRVLHRTDLSDAAHTPPPHIPWLQPFPDKLLEPASAGDAAPDAALITKETIELAFLVALQFLPPKQRAVLILCDVLDWSAKEAAELLDTSVAAVNGALQRARATLREQRPGLARERRPDAEPDERQRALLQRYVEAGERNDPHAIAMLLRDDVRCSMPPDPATWAGRDAVLNSWIEGGFGSDTFGALRCVMTAVNRMPAVACYLKSPGESEFKPLALDVLSIEDGLIAEITTFALAKFIDALGLPLELR